MSHTGHVNLSTRLDGSHMLLAGGTVAGMDAEAFAVVRFDGQVEEGTLDASTRETVGMHVAVYGRRPKAGSVVHTHSPHATAFALAHQPLPCRYEALLRRGQYGETPLAAWAPRGSLALQQAVTDTVEAHPTTSALLLANHGVLAWGPSPTAAVKLVVVIEEAAAAELRAVAIGGAQDLPAEALTGLRPSLAPGHGDGQG